MDLTQKKAAAQAKLDAAKAALTDEDRDELNQRVEIAKIETETEEEERRLRNLDLERRLDSAKDALGESVVEALSVDGFPDTFIIQRNGRAHGKWEDDMSSLNHPDRNKNRKLDRASIYRNYAVECIYDWNGRLVDGSDPKFTLQVHKYLTENPGIVSTITNVAAKLAGVFAENRKS
jgi:hypothetical protein